MTNGGVRGDAQQRWKEFCGRMRVAKRGVALFQADGLVVKTMPHGRAGRLALCRSSEMDTALRREMTKLTGATADQFDGLIYLMYTRPHDEPVPLYIGKAETIGRKGGLSANIKSLDAGGFFGRWGYGRYYHMGELSAAALGSSRPADQVHQRWAARLFESVPTSRPTLKEPVFFWTTAWSPSWAR